MIEGVDREESNLGKKYRDLNRKTMAVKCEPNVMTKKEGHRVLKANSKLEKKKNNFINI